jgi:hypothetical protein
MNLRFRARWRAWRLRRRPVVLRLSGALEMADAGQGLRESERMARIRLAITRPSGRGGQRPRPWEPSATWRWLYGREDEIRRGA